MVWCQSRREGSERHCLHAYICYAREYLPHCVAQGGTFIRLDLLALTESTIQSRHSQKASFVDVPWMCELMINHSDLQW